MVRLEELEQTVLGLVKKTLEQEGRKAMAENDEARGSGQTPTTEGQQGKWVPAVSLLTLSQG